MRIGIDANWAIYEQAGIGKYSENLIKGLLAQDKRNTYVLFFNFFKRPRERMKMIRQIVTQSKAKVELEISAFPAIFKEWLTQTALPPKYFFKKPVDIFHSPFFAGIPRVGLPKMIVTIHDLSFLKFPEHRGLKTSRYFLRRTRLATKNSKKIIVPSKATKKDLETFLKINPRKIQVIYEGVDREFRFIRDRKTIRKKLSKYLPPAQEFILSVCTLEPRKNLARLVKAFSLLPLEMQRKYRLVLIGAKGWNNPELFQVINNLNLKGKVILPGYVAQKDLPYFYNTATLFAYPSLYEGFGLPVLEAMACGAPVITSNVSSLPEVTGKAAILVNPLKEEEIAGSIRKLILSLRLQKLLRKKSLLQAKKFTWEKTASQTIKTYEQVFQTR